MRNKGFMMKTSCFDASLEFTRRPVEDPFPALLCVEKMTVLASVRFYDNQTSDYDGKKINFVQVYPSQPLTVRWKQVFTIMSPVGEKILGEGMVLDPFAEKLIRRQKKRRIQYLRNLFGDEKEMLLAVVQFRGIHGVQETEILRFGHHTRPSLLEMSQELEKDGMIRILEFSPLFIVSQACITFLCEKILGYLEQFHEKYPGVVGVESEKIQKRFDVHSRILALALQYLLQDGRIKKRDEFVALPTFEMALSLEEEKILGRMEEMYLKNKFQSLSLDELQRSFGLSPKRLNKMLSLLTERKKIVLGKDGFILHSRWLDELIQKIQSSGMRELTVSDFKDMTGLTRKYAIPLLELLDQKGVTRRRGSSHEIVQRRKKP
jgi:selenocysteine-specific elongation factor